SRPRRGPGTQRSPAAAAVTVGLLVAAGGAACRHESAPKPHSTPVSVPGSAPDGGAGSAPTAVAPQPPRGKAVAVLYGSDLLAAYETCGCPVHPMGGLARRATQIDRARAASDA